MNSLKAFFLLFFISFLAFAYAHPADKDPAPTPRISIETDLTKMIEAEINKLLQVETAALKLKLEADVVNVLTLKTTGWINEKHVIRSKYHARFNAAVGAQMAFLRASVLKEISDDIPLILKDLKGDAKLLAKNAKKIIGLIRAAIGKSFSLRVLSAKAEIGKSVNITINWLGNRTSISNKAEVEGCIDLGLKLFARNFKLGLDKLEPTLIAGYNAIIREHTTVRRG